MILCESIIAFAPRLPQVVVAKKCKIYYLNSREETKARKLNVKNETKQKTLTKDGILFNMKEQDNCDESRDTFKDDVKSRFVERRYIGFLLWSFFVKNLKMNSEVSPSFNNNVLVPFTAITARQYFKYLCINFSSFILVGRSLGLLYFMICSCSRYSFLT